MSRYNESLQASNEFSSINLVNYHLREWKESSVLASEFKGLKLNVSPHYVRHGLILLLG